MASCSIAADLSQSKETDLHLFGWDLLFQTISGAIREKSDIVIAFVHFLLVKQCSFRCIGIGQSNCLSPSDVGSELLPEKWNEDSGRQYALRYKHNQKLYVLIGQITTDCLILNLMDMKLRQVSNVTIVPDVIVREMKGCLADMIPRYSELYDRIHRELIEPIGSAATREKTTQTHSSSNNNKSPLDGVLTPNVFFTSLAHKNPTPIDDETPTPTEQSSSTNQDPNTVLHNANDFFNM